MKRTYLVPEEKVIKFADMMQTVNFSGGGDQPGEGGDGAKETEWEDESTETTTWGE